MCAVAGGGHRRRGPVRQRVSAGLMLPEVCLFNRRKERRGKRPGWFFAVGLVHFRDEHVKRQWKNPWRRQECTKYN